MKKLIVLLLALSAVGFVAIAQDAPAVVSSFSAYVDSGIGYIGGPGTDNLYFKGFDAGAAGGRFNLNGSWALGDFGLKFRLRGQPMVSAAGADLFVRRAYSYFNLFDKMLYLEVGKLGNGSYATAYNGNGTFDGDVGFLAQVTPISGLNIAFVEPVSTAGATFKDALLGTKIAATYSIDKIADFLVNARVFAGDPELLFSINVTAVENLGLIIEGDLTNLMTTDDTMYTGLQSMAFTEDVNYTMDKLNVGATFNETLPTGGDLAWDANPYVSYTVLENVDVGADFGYTSDSVITFDAWTKFTLGNNFIKGVVAYNVDTKMVDLKAYFTSSF